MHKMAGEFINSHYRATGGKFQLNIDMPGFQIKDEMV
jgi:hypothetical protein